MENAASETSGAPGRSARRGRARARGSVIAFTALFVALSGTAWAGGSAGSRDVARQAVGAKQIAKGAIRAQHLRKGAVRSKHIRKNSVRSKHVADGGLRTADIRDLDTSLKGLGDGLVTTGGYIGALLSDVESLKKRMSDAESKNGTLEADLDALAADLNALSAQSNAQATAIDARLDALCAQADTVNQEVRDLASALDAASLLGLNLSAVSLPDFDPAECQG